MRFSRNARLDAGQIRDRRGVPAGGVALGGVGGLGLVVLLLLQVLGGGGGGLGAGLGSLDGATAGAGAPPAECATGADANERADCRIVGVVNSVQDLWSATLPGYRPALTNFFTGQVNTACGAASSAVGPFYCPADEQVYIDLGFFDDLRSRFGAQGGDFAEAYVIAHEYGHHVQHLTGVMERSRALPVQEGPDGAGVKVELQADCYAGVWAHHATTTPDPATGVVLIEEITDADVAEALDAAAAVGDDRIQQATQGRVRPETWTHGSAEQRQQWFRIGLAGGDPQDCDTFA